MAQTPLEQVIAEYGFSKHPNPTSTVLVGGRGLAEWGKQRQAKQAAAVDCTDGSTVALDPTEEQA